MTGDPLALFHEWIEGPEVALATATRDGRPSVRMVLLKSADKTGFVFYSSYESRKGGELAANPRAALCFYWHGLGRQARIDGGVRVAGVGEEQPHDLLRQPHRRDHEAFLVELAREGRQARRLHPADVGVVGA